MARGVEEDQRHLLRKQPLEEDDNGPMTLELLAVPDGQVGRSSRASLLLMRPRRTTPGSPRKREKGHSPGPDRASTRQCRTPASDAVREVLARCRSSTGARWSHVGAAGTTRWRKAGCAVRSERWSRALSTAGATASREAGPAARRGLCRWRQQGDEPGQRPVWSRPVPPPRSCLTRTEQHGVRPYHGRQNSRTARRCDD